MLVRGLLIAVIGVSSVAGFAPFAPAACRRSGVASLSMFGGGKSVPRKSIFTKDLAPAAKVPYKGNGQYDALDALGVKNSNPIDTSYQKPPSSFSFANKPAASKPKPAAPTPKPQPRARAKPAVRAVSRPAPRAASKPAAAPSKPARAVSARQGSVGRGDARAQAAARAAASAAAAAKGTSPASRVGMGTQPVPKQQQRGGGGLFGVFRGGAVRPGPLPVTTTMITAALISS